MGPVRMRWSIAAVGAAVIVAFAASSGYDLWISHARVTAETRRELENLAKALAEQADDTLLASDQLLRDAATWVGNEHPGPGPQADAKLAAMAQGLPQVNLISIVDSHGIPYIHSHPVPPPAVNLAQRQYFITHRDQPKHGALLSNPLMTIHEHRLAIVISRRLDGRAGRFDGIVQAVVDLRDFQRVYQAIDLGQGSEINLLRDDGTLVVRQPAALDPVDAANRFPALATAYSEHEGMAASPIDGKPRFVGLARLADFPLVVVVMREQEIALAGWRAEAYRVGLRTLLLSVLGAAAIAALLTQLQRRERSERALRLSEAQLRQAQKLEAIGTLAGGIAHDFNNILGAILGYGELAQKAAAGQEAVRGPIDRVMHAGERARLLVQRILAFSRGGAGERRLVRVQGVVEEALELLSGSMTAQLHLERRLAAGNAAVIGDPTQLHQVVMNLCTNALHAMEQGGMLSVAVARTREHRERLLSHGAVAAGGYVRISVADTGRGIAPPIAERMFDPFFTTKGAGEGTGLGLSLVHGIVADMGGAIDVRTRPGRGTRFAIWLPLAGDVAEAPPWRNPGAHAQPQGSGQVVMVVDDETELVALTEELLAGLGYEPVGFTKSLAAAAEFERSPQRFDLVLTDEAMAELSGTELAKALHARRPELPIVLMSGYCSPALHELARSAGVCEVLAKPLRVGELAACLGRVLMREPA